MDVAAARDALAAAGLSATRIEPILGGWASWTFELDGELIVRFPRNEGVREAMQREMRLLPELASWVSFRVPVPLHMTEDWFAYEKISGRAFAPGDDVDGALAMIDELHSFPVERATALLQRPAWGWYLHDQWPVLEAAVLPTLDDDLAARVTDEYLGFIGQPFGWVDVLIHNDLGLEHILVDAAGKPVGMIDFEDAIVGDPEIDLVPISYELGLPVTRRMWFYRWVGSLHAIVYYVQEDEPEEVAAAAIELRRRLDSRPGQ